MPNLPEFDQKEFLVKSIDQNLRLIVVHTDQNFRFALFDALGAPIVDRALNNGAFENTKFLPPSPKFDELFVGVLKLVEKGVNSGVVKTSSGKFKVNYVLAVHLR